MQQFDFYVAACLLFDKHGKLLIYLRDDKPDISFPNTWDLFGGIMEAGESPEQTLVREVKEEIGVELRNFTFFKTYDCITGDIKPNRKYVYYAQIDYLPEELMLLDVGQKIISIDLSERKKYTWANILYTVVNDFVSEKRNSPES